MHNFLQLRGGYYTLPYSFLASGWSQRYEGAKGWAILWEKGIINPGLAIDPFHKPPGCLISGKSGVNRAIDFQILPIANKVIRQVIQANITHEAKCWHLLSEIDGSAQ